MLFEWKPGGPIMLKPNYNEVITPSNHITNKEPKGNVGHYIIVFGEGK